VSSRPRDAAFVEELVESLLFEGYALYPYTAGATKNATPTPFGIVYPPAYAAAADGPLDHLQAQCLARPGGPGCAISAEVRFLQPEGRGHRAQERRISLGEPGAEVAIDLPPLAGRASLSSAERAPGLVEVTLRVENRTVVAPGVSRTEALRSSLLSTHVVLRAGGAAFVSPLEAEACENVNTWPFLATDAGDVVVGAAMVLPDHPELAPQSRGSMFDGTEIEEALLLHVLALSDAEREQIAGEDPAVREMVARAAAAAPEELMRLHGVMRPAGEEER
jgi:hypothetical protein